MSRVHTTTAERLTKFTPMEVKVAYKLIDGLSNKEIAEALGIRLGTVKFHVTSVLSISGVKSRAELISKYFRKDPAIISKFPESTQFTFIP